MISRTFLIGFTLIMLIGVAAIDRDEKESKQKCLDKYNTLDYEYFNDVLYCKTSDGLVKFNGEIK